MNTTRAAALVSAAAFSLIPALLTAYSGGPPVRRTAAPGDRTCLDANCHVGTRFANSPDLTLDTGASAFTYTPGGPTQRFTIRINDANARAYGMQLTVRSGLDLTGRGAGSLAAATPLTSVICADEQFKGAAGCPGAQPVEFFHHTEPRRENSFSVDWTPPATAAAGDAVIYVIANASVTGQRNSRIHQRAFLLRPAGGPSVVNAASLSEGISPGSWITIFGRDFAGPGDLDVRVNGRPATIGFSSDTQINAVAPASDDNVGPVPVEIRRADTRLATVIALLQRTAPALFHVAHQNRRDAAATHSDGTPATGPEARPIRAGDTIQLYATGLGITTTARLGDGPANIVATTLVSPGLHRVEITVPTALPEGIYFVRLTSDGVTSPADVTLPLTR